MRDAGGLSGAVKVGYGAGELGIAAAEFAVRVSLLKLYVDVSGLAAGLAGAVLAIAVAWDAVTDLLMGEISDRTRLRWGRRRPWVAVGSPLASIFFIVLFSPPVGTSQGALALYLLAAYLAFNTALTLVAVPHAALGADLTSDPATRNEVYGWRFLFANLGLVLAIAVPAAASRNGGAGASGAPWLALALVGGGLIACAATRGFDSPRGRVELFSPRAAFRSLAAPLRSRAFRPLLAAYLLGSVALTLNASLALFYYEHRLRLGEREVFLWVLLPFALVIALSIGGWVLAARRWGKRWTAFAGVLLLGLGTAAVYPLFPAGELVGPVIWGLVGGFLVGSVFLLDATVADVAEQEGERSGVPREGVFFGAWRMASKVARAIGLAVTGLVLDGIGFVPAAADQAPAVRKALSLVFGPGVGALFVAAALLWLAVPLRDIAEARGRGPQDRRQ